MQALWRLALTLLATTVVFVVALAVVGFLASVSELTPGRVPPWATTLSLAGMLGLPIGAAFVAARTLGRRLFPADTRPRWSKHLLAVVAIGYLVTAVFGAPACQTFRSQWAVAEFTRMRTEGKTRPLPDQPHIATYAALPLLPCVVLEYHEYVLAGLYGFGGFELFVWYGSGVKSLGQLPLWVA